MGDTENKATPDADADKATAPQDGENLDEVLTELKKDIADMSKLDWKKTDKNDESSGS